MNIGIGHGYYAIKTRHFSFPAGISEYSHEPYTLQNTLEYGGKFLVCGTGRQPILRNKMENDNYYLLTLAAIAREIKQRGGKTECSVNIAAGLPLAGVRVWERGKQESAPAGRPGRSKKGRTTPLNLEGLEFARFGVRQSIYETAGNFCTSDNGKKVGKCKKAGLPT